MFCPHCGARLPVGSNFCGACGAAVVGRAVVPPVGIPEPTIAPLPRGPDAESHMAALQRPIGAGQFPVKPVPIGLFMVAGFLLGAFIGFLMRPAAFLIGQLPLETVITRGSSLNGLDQLLVPTAQSSFNMMLTGAIIGAIAGAIASRLLPGRSGPA
jgi:hypothetical protein